MEVPRLELEDLELAKLVTKLVEPLVITVEKQKRMIEILEKELDLGLQHGLTGQKPCSVLVIIVGSSRDSVTMRQGSSLVGLKIIYDLFVDRARINPDGKHIHSMSPRWVMSGFRYYL